MIILSLFEYIVITKLKYFFKRIFYNEKFIEPSDSKKKLLKKFLIVVILLLEIIFLKMNAV